VRAAWTGGPGLAGDVRESSREVPEKGAAAESAAQAGSGSAAADGAPVAGAEKISKDLVATRVKL